MASTFATLPDFIVTVDRALHTVVDRVDGSGNVVRTIDFGLFGAVAEAVNVWLDLESTDTRDAMAPAMNAYLLAEFAPREVKPEALIVRVGQGTETHHGIDLGRGIFATLCGTSGKRIVKVDADDATGRPDYVTCERCAPRV